MTTCLRPLPVSIPLPSQKLAYSSDGSVKAVLVKDKPAKAEAAAEPQQYIEVGHYSAVGHSNTLRWATIVPWATAIH